MSFLLEELIKTTKLRTFCKYEDLPAQLKGNLSELFDEGFCKTYSELDADGSEIGSFKLERIQIGHIAKALDSGEFSEEKESILKLFYDFMKKMNIEFIQDLND